MGWSKSRVTVGSTKNTEFILILLCVSYCVFICIFHMSNSDLTFALPCIQAFPPSSGHGELPLGVLGAKLSSTRCHARPKHKWLKQKQDSKEQEKTARKYPVGALGGGQPTSLLLAAVLCPR